MLLLYFLLFTRGWWGGGTWRSRHTFTPPLLHRVTTRPLTPTSSSAWSPITGNTMYRLSDSNLFTSDSQGRYIRLAHRMDTARLQWSSPYSDWFLGVNKKPSGSPVVCHRLNGNGNPPKAKDQPVSRLLYSII